MKDSTIDPTQPTESHRGPGLGRVTHTLETDLGPMEYIIEVAVDKDFDPNLEPQEGQPSSWMGELEQWKLNSEPTTPDELEELFGKPLAQELMTKALQNVQPA